MPFDVVPFDVVPFVDAASWRDRFDRDTQPRSRTSHASRAARAGMTTAPPAGRLRWRERPGSARLER
jgi:hypothetical protein